MLQLYTRALININPSIQFNSIQFNSIQIYVIEKIFEYALLSFVEPGDKKQKSREILQIKALIWRRYNV